jgi:tripartite-type tricarboxylate transporter receptor subunit TctC
MLIPPVKPARRALCATLLLAAAPAALRAKEIYPDRPIHLVVPYAAGGGVDYLERQLAVRLAQVLGQSIIVENRSGAGGTLGTNHVAKSAPDGYTLLGIDSGYTAFPALIRDLPWDFEHDLVPVTAFATTPQVMMVPANSPYQTVGQLIEAAKKAPGKLNFGSGGRGSSPGMAAQRFCVEAGVTMTEIPYKGGSESLIGLLSGQVDMLMTSPPTALTQMRAGKVRVLAVSSAERSSVLPDVPTFRESGLPGFVTGNWFGLFAPRGTPPAVIARLHEAVAAVLKLPDFRKVLNDQGAEPSGISSDRFARQIADEAATWKKIMAQAGITPQ